MPRHLRAFMRWEFVRRTKAEAAAMHVEHHRSFSGQARSPDVQFEHVFALPAVVPVEEESLLCARPCMQVLRAVCSIRQGWIFVGPRRGRFGGKPAVFSGCGLSVGYALESENAAVEKSAHFAVLRFGNRRTRSGAVARSLVGWCLDAVGSE